MKSVIFKHAENSVHCKLENAECKRASTLHFESFTIPSALMLHIGQEVMVDGLR